MDVVASGVEATPWGLNGYGFAEFAIRHPGNSVAAISNYWLSTVHDILAFEKEQPERCFRLRYEDFVSDPEQSTSQLLDFVQARPMPGITSRCFETSHDANGPGDQKIWVTSGINPDSIGRGRQVPVLALPPPLLEQINLALAELKYRTIDEKWNATIGMIDPRADAPSPSTTNPSQRASKCAEVAELISKKLTAAPTRPRVAFKQHSDSQVEHIHIIVEAGSAASAEVTWEFGFGRAACHLGERVPGEKEVGVRCTKIAGDASTWASLLAGTANLAVEASRGRIRCIDAPDELPFSPRFILVAELLGLRSASHDIRPSAPTTREGDQHP
jgi:hypothetical protein